MGYLKLVILVLAQALISPAFAQTCCPAGCAPEANWCVTRVRCGPAAFPSSAQRLLECQPASPLVLRASSEPQCPPARQRVLMWPHHRFPRSAH